MGENLAYVGEYGINPTGETPKNMWYNEISKYDFNNPGFSSTQIILLKLFGKIQKILEFDYISKISNICFMTGN